MQIFYLSIDWNYKFYIQQEFDSITYSNLPNNLDLIEKFNDNSISIDYFLNKILTNFKHIALYIENFKKVLEVCNCKAILHDEDNLIFELTFKNIESEVLWNLQN